MKACTCLPVASLVVLLSGVVLAQDPVKVDSSHYKVLFENAGVRVLKISYRPGEKSTMHQHPDSLAIVLAPSTISFETPDGKTEERELPMESRIYTPAVTHRPANVGTTQMEAILVEFKTADPGTATLPSRDRAWR
jgi:quercetin dioxygenase-like cupin family protein